MLQTAKLFARRGSTFDVTGNSSKHMNGLTFGEFCVLASDLKRFRTHSLIKCHDKYTTSSLPPSSSPASPAPLQQQPTTILTNNNTNIRKNDLITNFNQQQQQQEQQQAGINNEQITIDDGEAVAINKLSTATTTTPTPAIPPSSDVSAPEVFLGGSCNPTTWRADVAIPALNKLGISFYNPVNIICTNSFFFGKKSVIIGVRHIQSEKPIQVKIYLLFIYIQ